jgi:hypothetical protein
MPKKGDINNLDHYKALTKAFDFQRSEVAVRVSGGTRSSCA